MFKNFSIRNRLLFGSVVFVLGLLCISFLGLLQSTIIANKVNVIVDHEFPQYVEMTKAYQNILELEIIIRNHVISPYDSSADRFQQKITEKRAAIDKSLASVGAGLDLELEADSFNQFVKAWQDYQKIQDRAVTLALSNRRADAIAVINGDGLILFTHIGELYKTIGDQRIQHSLDRGIEINDLIYNIIPFVSVVIDIAAVLIVSLLSLWTIRGILQPLNTLLSTTKAVSNGDLTKRANVLGDNELGILSNNFNQMVDNLEALIKSESKAKAGLQSTISTYMAFVQKVATGDLRTRLNLTPSADSEMDAELVHLGQTLNQMADSFTDITLKIRENASGVAASAAEILAMSNQQIASATQQHAAVAQTVATVEEIRVTVSQSSERAQAVAETARQSLDVSHNGQLAVEETVRGMESLRERVESIAQNILALSERTQQIGEIITTVNEIADQSKFLALNASIEAARAGEDGKGFAVVAMEVRQLAEQSREATARVRDILSEIQQATNTAVMVTEQGNKGAEQGMILVEQAGRAISELAAIIEDASQAATQIAASASQQSNGMNQLAMAMAQIEQATRQTATSTVQTEKSTRDLNEMARHMQESAARYQIADANQ